MKALFNQLSTRKQTFLFFCFWVLCFVAFGFLSKLLIQEVFKLPNIGPGTSDEHIFVFKIIQLITSVGIFILPPLLAVYLFKEKPWNFLKLDRGVGLNSVVLIILILFFSIPVLNLVIDWNASLHLPAAFSEVEDIFRLLEDQAEVLTKAFLNVGSMSGFLINLFIIALIPALGEELLFRGVLQQYLGKIFKNAHFGIWSAALIFSFLHLQFFGFFPRLLLGALFGYLFYWSGSLWVPILAHFINNATAVSISYYSSGEELQDKIDAIGTIDHSWYYSIPSALLLVLMLRFFRKENEVGLEKQ